MSDVAGAEAPEVKPPDSEREARNLGWVDKEEFKGDPSKWRPAEEFLDRGKRILPIVLKDNERLQRNLDRVKDQLAEVREQTKQLVDFHTKAEERAYERARKEIESKIEVAAANADQATVRNEMHNLDALNKSNIPVPKTETKTTPTNVDPIIQDWIDKEDWFTKDRALNAYAVDVFGSLERDKPGVSKAELLAETKRRTVDKFPEKFGINPAREDHAAVATPSGTGSRKKGGRTYDNLPADAKQACDKFVRTIPKYTKEQYVKDYDWEA